MPSLIELLNQAGHRALEFAWPLFWQSGLLIGALWLLDALLRGDVPSRFAAYATGRQWGFDNEYFFRWRIDGKEKHLHLINSDEPRVDVLAQHPDKAAELEQLTRAYFETAKYIINHNGRDSAPSTAQDKAP